MSGFLTLFPAWMAEKLLILLYVTGMALSFRFLIKQLNPGNVSLSLLIFPFIYSFLFHLGFYNFSISFIFFFLTLGYYLKTESGNKLSAYLVLFVLITLTYFSNTLIYGFLGLTLGLFIIYRSYMEFSETKNFSNSLKSGTKKLLVLLIVSLPSLLFLGIFLSNVVFFPSDQSLSNRELMKWINDARPFIIFDYVKEETFTTQLFHILLVLFILSIIPSANSKVNFTGLKIVKADILLFPIIISVILLFITPNGSNAGMMSDRYCLMAFLFGLVWVSARTKVGTISSILVLFAVFLHFGLQYRHIKDTLVNLDKDAKTIYSAGAFVKENSIVLPVNVTDHWIEPHFSNYLGVDKPLIILENYEASVGWFPIKWNSEKLPKILLGDKNSVNGIGWISNNESQTTRQIDYVIVYGHTEKLLDENWKELSDVLAAEFDLTFTSDNKYVTLFERR